jgi:hypothetical protein
LLLLLLLLLLHLSYLPRHRGLRVLRCFALHLLFWCLQQARTTTCLQQHWLLLAALQRHGDACCLPVTSSLLHFLSGPWLSPNLLLSFYCFLLGHPLMVVPLQLSFYCFLLGKPLLLLLLLLFVSSYCFLLGHPLLVVPLQLLSSYYFLVPSCCHLAHLRVSVPQFSVPQLVAAASAAAAAAAAAAFLPHAACV